MVESPMELQKSTKLTENHLKVCEELGLPTEGNAAGNTVDLLDLTGANKPPAPLPAGFTPKGIVALVFSILSAFIGIAVIAWSVVHNIYPSMSKAARSNMVNYRYGVGDLGPSELASAKKYVAQTRVGK